MPEIGVLSKKVKEYRKNLKKTQVKFSQEIGISIEELSLIERAKANPRLSTIQKIAGHMGITVADLLEVEEGQKK